MIQQYMKELDQDSYNSEDFVERLAWRTVDDLKEDGTAFDPLLLHETFLQTIEDLQVLQEQQVKKCEQLKNVCKEEEAKYKQYISKLQGRHWQVESLFENLDERINSVASKVIHLGCQLEGSNVPRSRAAEAQKLMMFFNEFESPGPVVSKVFQNKEDIFEAADIIQKLHMISQEFLSAKFQDSNRKINVTYDEIERSLIEELVKAHRIGDIRRMKQIATILTHFKSYSQCVDAFIEECLAESFVGGDLFEEIVPFIKKNLEIIEEVFINTKQIVAKFVLNIYQLKLKKYIVSRLSSDKECTSKYLMNLNELYTKSMKLSSKLSCSMGIDGSFLNKLTEAIFQKYLGSYISVEVIGLSEKLTLLLQKYYDSKGHHKKQIHSSGLLHLRRDLQAVIGTNISLVKVEDYGSETFLSEELVISFIQESNEALKRCQLLSSPSELASNTVKLLEVLLNAVIIDHMDYAVELALQTLSIPESKTQAKQIIFFDVVRQANTLVHLLEKHFSYSVLPLVISTPKHIECLMKKQFLFAQLEQKLDNGIDLSLNAIAGWVKVYLQAEQKKTDYKPDTDRDTLSSPACLAVVQYISKNVDHIKACIDGRNIDCIMTELGCRLHRVIYDHLQQFQYNFSGALCVICDMNEYRKCIHDFNSPLLNTLFDTLYALCNLLVVKSENLNEVCTGDHLALLDKSILFNFIQLRADYKAQKFATFFNVISSQFIA